MPTSSMRKSPPAAPCQELVTATAAAGARPSIRHTTIASSAPQLSSLYRYTCHYTGTREPTHQMGRLWRSTVPSPS